MSRTGRTVRWHGVDLPACAHPVGCDLPAAPNVYVCDEHMPEPIGTLDEIAARIGEFSVRKRGNGWAVEHWSGCWLPIPMAMAHPHLGATTFTTWMAPRWVAEAAFEAYRRGERPETFVTLADGSVGRADGKGAADPVRAGQAAPVREPSLPGLEAA